MSAALQVFSTTVTTTGSAGSATGSATLDLPPGYVEWMYFDFNASAAATTDTTVAYSDTPPGANLLVLTNANTDGLYSPRRGLHTSAGAAITDSHARWTAGEQLTVSIAQGDALDPCLTIYVAVSDE